MSGLLSAFLLSVPGGEYTGVFVAAHFTVSLGLMNPRKMLVVRGADYSYGIYLYGWPVQQAIAATGTWARHTVVNAVAALVLTSVFAAFSWHLVEKPALRLRAPLRSAEELWLRFRGGGRQSVGKAKTRRNRAYLIAGIPAIVIGGQTAKGPASAPALREFSLTAVRGSQEVRRCASCGGKNVELKPWHEGARLISRSRHLLKNMAITYLTNPP